MSGISRPLQPLNFDLQPYPGAGGGVSVLLKALLSKSVIHLHRRGDAPLTIVLP